MCNKQKVIYFKNETEDDFSGIKRKTIDVDNSFSYSNNNLLSKAFSFIVYKLIMYPFVFLYTKIKFRHKIVNKKILKPYEKKGYVMYGNHTLMAGDAFIPNLINYRKTYMIVHADNVSQRCLKNFMLMNGAIPIPTNPSGMKNFLNHVKARLQKGNPIVIYPEAHVWPYYTKIRPFHNSSFNIPIKLDCPVFCFTNTFVKTKFRKTPKVITYVDGPFEYDKSCMLKQCEEQLKNSVHKTMEERAEKSDYQFIKYVKVEE